MSIMKFFIMLICLIIAVFLGAFSAFYTIFGYLPNYNHLKLSSNTIPKIESKTEIPFSQVDKMIENQQKFINNLNEDFQNYMSQSFPQNPLVSNNTMFMQNVSANFELKELKEAYQIKINLKPFNNDEKNVNVKINGNKIAVSAKYQSKSQNAANESNFYQSLTLPTKIKENNIKKQKEGDFLVITIPKKSEQKIK